MENRYPNRYPDRCPRCDMDLVKEIVGLREGGFLYLERCPLNMNHYEHYRRPTYKETMELNK